VLVDRGREPIQLLVVMLDSPLDASAVRQAQVRQLAGFVQELARRRDLVAVCRDLVAVCGDFHAGPDADELPMLTGKVAPATPGLIFYNPGRSQAAEGRAIHGPTTVVGQRGPLRVRRAVVGGRGGVDRSPPPRCPELQQLSLARGSGDGSGADGRSGAPGG
jgi:hypothetical protein